MATIREQYVTAMVSRDKANKAFDATVAAVKASPEFRNLKALKREHDSVLNGLWSIFQKGDFTAECADFKKFRQDWGMLIPMTSPVLDEVQALEIRIKGLENQIRADGRKVQPLLDAQIKAKKAQVECQAKFVQMRDLDYRSRQSRQTEQATEQADRQAAKEQYAEKGAEAMVDGVLSQLDQSRRRGDSHTAKAPRPKGSSKPKGKDKTQPKEKDGKGARKRKALQEANARG